MTIARSSTGGKAAAEQMTYKCHNCDKPTSLLDSVRCELTQDFLGMDDLPHYGVTCTDCVRECEICHTRKCFHSVFECGVFDPFQRQICRAVTCDDPGCQGAECRDEECRTKACRKHLFKCHKCEVTKKPLCMHCAHHCAAPTCMDPVCDAHSGHCLRCNEDFCNDHIAFFVRDRICVCMGCNL